MAVFVHVSTRVYGYVCLCVYVVQVNIKLCVDLFSMALKWAIVEILMQKKGSDYSVHVYTGILLLMRFFPFPFSMLFIFLSLCVSFSISVYNRRIHFEHMSVRMCDTCEQCSCFFSPIYTYIVYTQAISIYGEKKFAVRPFETNLPRMLVFLFQFVIVK